MNKSGYDTEPCGVKLMRLIDTRSHDIARREVRNDNMMCLYRTGEYWHGFEHSAYFLTRIFPKAEAFVVNNPNYPFPIVGVSILDSKLRRFSKTNSVLSQSEDYLEFETGAFEFKAYAGWHEKTVKEFMNLI